MPADLLDAIGHASSILGWHENLPESDIPPEWMWHLPRELEDHFERLHAKRHSQLDGSRDDDDDDEGGGFMMQNEYARGRGRHAR